MRLILTSFAIFFASFINAQIKKGIIKFDMLTNLTSARADILAEGIVPESMLAMFPKEIKKLKQLRFTESKSMFENVLKTSDENGEVEPQDANSGASLGFKQVGTSANIADKIFINLIEYVKIERQTFYDKSFVIKTDSVTNISWKPTGNQKLILNFPCYEAIRIEEVQYGKWTKIDTIRAWYTLEIEVKSGPMGYCNLPGMILQLHYGSSISFTATEVISKEINEEEIIQPIDGKKISAFEYRKIREKKLKEKRSQFGKPRIMSNSPSDSQ